MLLLFQQDLKKIFLLIQNQRHYQVGGCGAFLLNRDLEMDMFYCDDFINDDKALEEAQKHHDKENTGW